MILFCLQVSRMKLFFCLFIFGLFPLGLHAPSSKALRFCSYNIHRFSGDNNQFQKIERTLQKARTAIEQNTLFHFQEVMNEKAVQKLQKMSLGHYPNQFISTDRPNVSVISGSLPFTILERGVINTSFTRAMSFVILKIAGIKILSVNCHWPSQFHHFNMRLAQATLLRKFLLEKLNQNQNLKIIVSGDFNLLDNEVILIDFFLRPILSLVKNDSPTYYYSRKKSWNHFDLFWTNFCKDKKCLATVVINSINSTIGKYKNGKIYLRPKKNFNYESYQDRQGPSDHFPVCFELPF